jgi:hypothetical protein
MAEKKKITPKVPEGESRKDAGSAAGVTKTTTRRMGRRMAKKSPRKAT